MVPFCHVSNKIVPFKCDTLICSDSLGSADFDLMVRSIWFLHCYDPWIALFSVVPSLLGFGGSVPTSTARPFGSNATPRSCCDGVGRSSWSFSPIRTGLIALPLDFYPKGLFKVFLVDRFDRISSLPIRSPVDGSLSTSTTVRCRFRRRIGAAALCNSFPYLRLGAGLQLSISCCSCSAGHPRGLGRRRGRSVVVTVVAAMPMPVPMPIRCRCRCHRKNSAIRSAEEACYLPSRALKENS